MKKKLRIAIGCLGIAFGAAGASLYKGQNQNSTALLRVLRQASEAAKKIGLPQAMATEGQTQLQTMRTFFWLVLGFPSASDYASSIASHTTLAGQDGIVGRIDAIRETIVDIILSTYNPASCKAFVSEDRTLELSAGGTLSFEAAKLTPPTNFPHTTQYDKRAIYAGKDSTGQIDLLAAFEFYCEYNGVAAVFTEKKVGVEQAKYVVYYDRDAQSEKGAIDFYMNGAKDVIASDDIALALQVRIDESAKTFESWLTRTSTLPRKLGYRYATHANYETQENSFMAVDVAINEADALTSSQWATTNAVADSTVTGLNAPSTTLTTNAVKIGGCAKDFDVNLKTTISMAEPCDGLPLREGPAPAIDSSGSMSLKWVEANLATKLSNL